MNHSDSASETRAIKLQRRYAQYDTCPRCNALPANPCRERGMTGHNQPLNSPHLNRPRKEPS